MSTTPAGPRFSVHAADGRGLDPVVPESLRPFLLDHAGDPGGPVVLTGRSDGAPGREARATPAADGSWLVETEHDGEPLVARAPNTDAVFDLLRSRAAADGWWLEAFGWMSHEGGFGSTP